MQIDKKTDMISGTPSETDMGTYNFVVYADIPKVACDSQTIAVHVSAE